MPVTYLTPEQRNNYGRYAESPSEDDLAHFFYMSDEDHALINRRRGNLHDQLFVEHLDYQLIHNHYWLHWQKSLIKPIV